MTRVLTLAALLVTLAAPDLRAQDALTGSWQGETGTGATLGLTLAAKDGVLTGTLVRKDQTTQITDGKVTRNTFTFKATLNDQAEQFSGEVSGDEMKIWLDRQGPSRAIVLRRAKGKPAR